MLTVSADQNTRIPVNGKITDHGKRSFEWTSNGDGNVLSNWMVKKTSSRIGRSRKRRLEVDGEYL